MNEKFYYVDGKVYNKENLKITSCDFGKENQNLVNIDFIGDIAYFDNWKNRSYTYFTMMMIVLTIFYTILFFILKKHFFSKIYLES